MAGHAELTLTPLSARDDRHRQGDRVVDFGGLERRGRGRWWRRRHWSQWAACHGASGG